MYLRPSDYPTKVVDTVLVQGVPEKTITTFWEYDAMHRIIALYDAYGSKDQKVTRYRYNSLGEKETIIKPSGIELHHSYDALGRLIHFYASDKSFDYTYEYNANSLPICITDNIYNNQTLKEYDENDRLVKEVLGNTLTMQYTYDHLDRVIQLTLPDQSAVHYEYDACYLKKVSRGNYSHAYKSFDTQGHVLEEELPLKLGVQTFSYDLNGRSTASQSKYYSEKDLTYDTADNLISYTSNDYLGELSHRYTYDDLYQLIEEEGAFYHSYKNDSLYNRVEKNGKQHKHNDLNQCLDDGEDEYVYDSSGNLIQEGDTRYEYDALDRLIRVCRPNEYTQYTYDAMNRRLSKRTIRNGHTIQKERYLYHGQNEIGCYEKDSPTYTLKELRILGVGLGAEIGASVAMEFSGKIYIPFHDHNGNITTLVRANGWIFESYRYSAFGEIETYDQGKSPTTSTLNPWKFSSKRQDLETGFVYFGRRYYFPKLGRWITQDPSGYDEGPNLYAYVFNSPLFHYDLYGLFACGFTPFNPPISWNMTENQIGHVDGVQAFNGFCNLVKDTYFNPHVQGGLQALGGFSEACMGAGLTTLSSGFAAPIGYAVMAHGFDQFITGISTAIRGTFQSSYTASALEKAGLSHQAANYADMGIGVVGANCSTLLSGAKLALATGGSVLENIGTKFRSFTEKNFRENTKLFTGISPPGNIHAHHVFPQKFKKEFFKNDININDPRYATWWGEGHLEKAKEYNEIWFDFFYKNPNATQKEVLKEGARIMSTYGFEVNF